MGGKGKGKGAKGMTSKGKGKGESKGKGQGKDRGGKSGGKWVEVKGNVLVTGAAGYLQMSIVRRLVDRSYKVRGTVGSLEDPDADMLKRAFPDLALLEADGGEALEKAMEGCKYVVHAASSVEGTEAVLQAAKKAGIARVVLTSCIEAIGPPSSWMADAASADKEKVFNEETWNKDDSKHLAEEKAWELVSGSEDMSLVTICPAFMIGPMLGNSAGGESDAFIKAMLDGTMKADGCKFCSPVVDVRDVSLAHVIAMESAEAGGKRVMLSSEKGYTGIELANMLKDRFKAYSLPTEGGPEPEYLPKFDAARAKELVQFKPRPVEISMRDMVKEAIRHNIVERKFLLKAVKFSQISKVNPDSKGVDLLVKVMSVQEPETSAKGNGSTQEVQVGDSSGIVTLWLVADEVGKLAADEVIEVRNAAVKMIKGFIRLQVGKWGKIMKHAEEVEITPNSETNVSAVEYELVAA